MYMNDTQANEIRTKAVGHGDNNMSFEMKMKEIT